MASIRPDKRLSVKMIHAILNKLRFSCGSEGIVDPDDLSVVNGSLEIGIETFLPSSKFSRQILSLVLVRRGCDLGKEGLEGSVGPGTSHAGVFLEAIRPALLIVLGREVDPMHSKLAKSFSK